MTPAFLVSGANGNAARERYPRSNAPPRHGVIFGAVAISLQTLYVFSRNAVPVGPRPRGTGSADMARVSRYPFIWPCDATGSIRCVFSFATPAQAIRKPPISTTILHI